MSSEEVGVVPSGSTSCLQFSLLLLKDLLIQNFCHMITILDLLVVTSYSPFWDSPSMEPMAQILDPLCFFRVIFFNIIFFFRRSSGIWPDLFAVLVASLSVFCSYELVMSWSVFMVSILVIFGEFASSFWSSDRRRQRRLWVHNAQFRITALRRNPFQRTIRRSLLLPLISDQPPAMSDLVPKSPPQSPTYPNRENHKNIVVLDGKLISTFTDIIPKVTGYRAEKRALHVHSIETNSTAAAPAEHPNVQIVFLHQFGSGAFTWQQVMSELGSSQYTMLAYDRVAHGMTFADPNPIVDEGNEDATPHAEDLTKVVHFSDAIQSEEFDASLIDQLSPGNHKVVIVSCGGAGARLALLYARQINSSRVAGLVMISPYGINLAGGVPSILKSVASAAVGRALIVSMARSEILQVIPHRGWHAPTIPEKVLETYAKSVEVPGWEETMLGYLQRPTGQVDVSIPSDLACMVIEGEYDRCRESSDEYIDLCSKMGSHVVLTTVPEVGAWPQEEKPLAVAEIIKQFMTSIR